MAQTPLSVLRYACHYLPEVFKPAQQLTALYHLTDSLLWVPSGIFECELGKNRCELAFAAGVIPSEPVWTLLQPFLLRTSQALPDTVRGHLNDFLNQVQNPDFLKAIHGPSLWFEWALAAESGLPLLDGLYLKSDHLDHPQYAQQDWHNFVTEMYLALTGRPCPPLEKAQLDTVLGLLPESVQASYLGLMFARNNTLKLCLTCPELDSLKTLIARLELPTEAMFGLFDKQVAMLGDFWVLNLDLGPRFRKRWGLEAYLHPSYKQDGEIVRNWTYWLNALSLCTPEQAEGIRQWQTEPLPYDQDPAVRKANYKCLNHFKFISEAGELSVKAYLYFACRYLRTVSR
ncbi:MAG: hypothetical protein IV090_15490 [Candidatus Sericytochromatia bacterium]|nr:hypothetical protein [Candidatus Sericytochromatia bacterium]